MKEERYIDPRIQFVLLMVIGVYTLFLDVNQLIILNVGILIYVIYSQNYKRAVKTAVLLVLTILLHYYIMKTDNQIIKYMGFLTFTIIRFSPVLMLASVIQEVPSGKLITSLQSLKISKNILITLTVSLRFFPVIKKENEAIQISAKLRGLSIMQPRNWIRPLASFEYTFVPLMMRTLKISDELSASAMTKGIDYPGQRTSIYSNDIRISDILITVFIVALCIFIWFKGSSIGGVL